MNKIKSDEILNELKNIIPNPVCELNFNNTFELIIAVTLSAQTTDKRVNEVTEVLYKKYNTIEKLADADIEDIKRIIRPIGTFNKKAIFVKDISKALIDKTGGIVVNDREVLESLPGVGRKTVNVVLNVLFDEPTIAVDTHVDRVSKRLGLAKRSDDVLKVEKKLMKEFSKDNWNRIHHQLVLFGRYKCKSIKPICEDCKLKDICNYKKK